MSINIETLVKIKDRIISSSSGTRTLSGLFLTKNSALTSPILPFYSKDEVLAIFGATSNEYLAASVYFQGYNNSLSVPSVIYFGQYDITTTVSTKKKGVDNAEVAAATTAEAMADIMNIDATWAGFSDCCLDLTDAEKIDLASWASENKRLYVMQVTSKDTLALLATKTFGYVSPNYGDKALCAFVLGVGASINYNKTNGRITFAYKLLDGLTPSVNNNTLANELDLLSCNYYGSYSSLSNQYQFYQSGVMSGDWSYMDNYYNSLWLDDAITTSLVDVLKSSSYIPYTTAGYETVKIAINQVMKQAIVNSVAEADTTISDAVARQLYVETGQDIASILVQVGYYISVSEPTTAIKAKRGSPDVVIYYTNGGAIQKITVDNTFVK